MSEQFTIYYLNNAGNSFKEIHMIRPKIYQELLNKLQVIQNTPKNFKLFYLSPKGEEIEINNNESLKQAKEIIFIRRIKVDVKKEKEEGFDIFYNQAPEQIKEILDEKYLGKIRKRRKLIQIYIYIKKTLKVIL